MVLAALLSLGRPGATQELVLRTYSVEDGLPAGEVDAILQDRQGHLWVGTAGGAARFDGQTMVPIHLPGGDRKCGVQGFAEDARGRIWIATFNQGVYLVENGRAQKVGMEAGLPERGTYCVAADRDHIYVGAVDGLFKGEGSRFQRLGPELGAPGRLVVKALRDGGGTLWFGTGSGLYALRQGAFRHWSRRQGLQDERVTALADLGGGRVAMGTPTGISIVEGDGIRHLGRREGLTGMYFRSLASGLDGALWAGFHTGIARIDTQGIRNYHTTDGLPTAQVLALFRDREGSLWIGSKAGLSRVLRQPFVAVGPADGLPHASVLSLLEDRRGRLWVGTEGGLALRTGNRFQLLGASAGLPSSQVTGLLEDRQGRIWVATSAGLARVEGNRIVGVPPRRRREENMILCLEEDPEGQLWAGTEAGLFKLQGGLLVPQRQQEVSHFATALLAEPGGMWWGDARGLHFRGREAIDLPFGPALPGAVVTHLLRDSRGRLWIATSGGLALREAGTVRVFTRAEGLSSEDCAFVSEGPDGSIWVGSTGGLDRWDGHGFRKFGRREGLPSLVLQCTVRRPTGPVRWFGTARGLARLVPDPAALPAVPPLVELRGIEVAGRKLPLVTGLRLSHRDRGLVVRFAGVWLQDPTGLRFKYRMEPLDGSWRSTTEREVTYPFLPPGEYTFQVGAEAVEGGPAAAVRTLRVRIDPPPWATWWFRIAAASAVAAAAFGWNRLRTRRLRRQKQVLERRVAERTQELAARKEELEQALGQVRTLSGLVPICAGCKKIRDDQGFWRQLEAYIEEHSHAAFSHGLCPECIETLYPEQFAAMQRKGRFAKGHDPEGHRPEDPDAGA